MFIAGRGLTFHPGNFCGHLELFITTPAAVTKKLGLGFSIFVAIPPSHTTPPSRTLSPALQGSAQILPQPRLVKISRFPEQEVACEQGHVWSVVGSFYPCCLRQ